MILKTQLTSPSQSVLLGTFGLRRCAVSSKKVPALGGDVNSPQGKERYSTPHQQSLMA